MSGIRPGADNRTGGPERQVPVGEDELERALRETMTRQVATSRLFDSRRAEAVMRRSRRVGRRRTLTGLALAGVATVLVSTGVAQINMADGGVGPPTVVLGDPPGPSAPATSSPPGPSFGPIRAGLDLIIDGWLAGSGGEMRELAGVSGIERAQRIHDRGGWLLTSVDSTAGRTLWWAPAGDGKPQVVLAAAEAVAISADGRQIAWRDGPHVVAAGVVAGQVIALTRTPAPTGAVPVGFAGDEVLIQQPDDGGMSVWNRALDGVPGPVNPDVRAVYGMRPDGRLVGLVSSGPTRRSCVALLDPADDLAAVRTGCGPEPAADGLGAVSPDGRWLLVNGTAGTALLVDLATLATTAMSHPAGPVLAGPAAWTRAGTALHIDPAGKLLRVTPERVLAGERPTPWSIEGAPPGRRPVVVADVPAPPDGA
ncbi:hypothetical protein [Micromonospora sp. DT31]|uniref:hypothetical protein n=1 Tax=Micromonospora sp. DT31 TaxID=3393434 RepID=UPI003CF1A53B